MRRVDELRDRVLELLRREDRPLQSGAIATLLNTPTHAVITALQQPHVARQVRFGAAGWELADTFTPLPTPDDPQQALVS